MTVFWLNAQPIDGRSYVCGYCGNKVGPALGYTGTPGPGVPQQYPGATHFIYICSLCNYPSYFAPNGPQVPGQPYGEALENLPTDVSRLYAETRAAMTANAFTCATMALRTLLAHVAVERGANAGQSFQYYVTYLVDQHYVPPDARPWVDHIRTTGNEAVHDLQIVDSAAAQELLAFAEMILRLIYVYPTRAKGLQSSPPLGP